MRGFSTTGRAAALLGLTAVAVAAGGAVHAQGKLPGATGRIVYSIKGASVNGTQSVTWAGGGTKFRTDADMVLSMNGQKMPMKGWSISDGKNLYTLQPGMNQAMKMKAPKQMGPDMGLPGMAPGANGAMSGKVTGKETILGKTCEVRQMGEAMRVSTWQGMPLKMVVTAPQAGGSITILATKVEVPAKVDPSRWAGRAGRRTSVRARRPPGM